MSLRKFRVTRAHRSGRLESYTRFGYDIADVEAEESMLLDYLSLTVEEVAL